MNPIPSPDIASPNIDPPGKVAPVGSADLIASKDHYESTELFGDRKEIQIIHNAEVYRLRRTRHDKLILYK